MFCPVCSQEQVSEQTRFCSRCGFLLTGISEVISKGGVMPQTLTNDNPNAISPRKKGLKQGALLLFAGFLLVPLLAIITVAVRAEPFVVAAAAILFGGGGFLRLVYALLFESGNPTLNDESVIPESLQNILPGKKKRKSLPPQQQSVPASSYMPPAVAGGNWRDTNDLAAPPSVTEPTTKLLQKEEK